MHVDGEEDMHTEVHGIRMYYRIDGRDGAPWVVYPQICSTDLDALWLLAEWHEVRKSQKG
jgi:hypothetical protein